MKDQSSVHQPGILSIYREKDSTGQIIWLLNTGVTSPADKSPQHKGPGQLLDRHSKDSLS